MIVFNPLWKTLIDRNMTKTQLREEVGFSMSTLAKMGRNDKVSLEIIEKICDHLDCDISDVIQFKKE